MSTMYIAFVLDAAEPTVYKALGVGNWDEAREMLHNYNHADTELTFCVEVAPDEERLAWACRNDMEALAGIAYSSKFYPQWAKRLYWNWRNSPDREFDNE